jgi:hypothetical protein
MRFKQILFCVVIIGIANLRIQVHSPISARRVKLISEFPAVQFKILEQNFITALSSQDRKLLKEILSGDPEILTSLLEEHPDKVQIKYEELEHPQEGRTIYLKLDAPGHIAGREIRVLRIKGIRPRVTGGKNLPPYRGVAHDRSPLVVDYEGNIYRGEETFDILGGIREEWARVEFETTKMLASMKDVSFGVDYPLALGVMKNLKFVDQHGQVHNSAFIIFGMEYEDVRFGFQGSDEESRAFLYLCYYYNQRKDAAFQRIPEGEDAGILTAIGRALRELHDKGIFHRYPTATNIGIEPTSEGFRIIFRDLGDSVWRENLTENVRAQEIGWRFIDITRIIYDLHLTHNVAVYEDGLYFEDADARRLILPFLRGYFFDLDIGEKEIQPLLTSGFQQKRERITNLSPGCEDPVFAVLFDYLFKITPGGN